MKKRFCLAVLLAVALIGVEARAADDLEAFQGTWKLVRGESNGQEIPDDKLPNGKVTFEKDHFEVTFGDQTAEGTIKIDADRDPKTFDAEHESGADRGKTQYGIYKFEDEKLIVCSAAPGSPEIERPTEFRTRPDGNEVLFEFEREN
jgi:uncharacterized protein (TIGR03067 family)